MSVEVDEVGTAALLWAARTHTGLVRPHNEDSLLTGPNLLVVADGMGGHAAGEVASSLTVQTLAEAVPGAATADAVTGAVRAANRAILDAARTSEAMVDMGTTVTGVALLAEGLLVFNVGDSRVYRLHEGLLEQMTHDHSVVAELVASGALDPGLAQQHPERNVVTRALGVVGDVEVDAWVVPATAGDRWLVCSDGLSNEVSPAQMAQALEGAPSPAAACERLVALALESGARDNVTVIVAEVVAADAGGEDGPATPGAPQVASSDHDTQPRPQVLTAVPGLSRTVPDAPPPPPLRDVPLSRTSPDGAIPAGQSLITDVPGPPS